MIVITTNHKDKTHEFKYEGEINIILDPEMIRIDWYIEEIPPPIDDDALMTWRSNGYDWFWTMNVVSIRGE